MKNKWFQSSSAHHPFTILCIFTLIFLIPCIWCGVVYSAQVELTWDPPSIGSPAGYKIHYGRASQQYTESIDTGNCSTWSMSGLEENKTYYFAVTAYDDRAESGFSNEVSKFIPVASSSGEDVAQMAFDFTANAQGMTYKDDLFRGTSQAGYASGNFVSSDGYTGGGLKVTLGGMDSGWVTNGMSGGWSTSFTVCESGPVSISLRYRLQIAGEYEADEYSQMLVSVDGKLIGMNGTDYLCELRGTNVDTPLQDSGWRTATIQPTLSAGNHTLTVGVWNNKKTGPLEITYAYVDDIRISQSLATVDQAQMTFDFTANAQGMIYKDDLFCGTSQASYASGNFVSSDGYAGGGLKVTLGGMDSAWVTNGMSGGWSTSFTVSESGPVSISLRYRLQIAGEYEADEYSQMLVSVDGKLIGMNGKDYLCELRGTNVDTPLQDSGWRTATIQPTLSAGNHTLAVGVWNNKKTGPLEITHAYVDDIRISQSLATVDQDGDGFSVDDGDCNDANGSIYPGATEICGDGVDQNCDGKDQLCTQPIDDDGDGVSGNPGDTDDSVGGGQPGSSEICGDNIDNDMDGLTDCLDSECHASCGGGPVQKFGFDANAEAFVYKDDLFRGTYRPQYASGGYSASEGYSGGGLKVSLGGMDANWVTDGMSGGWAKSFEVYEGGPVSIRFKYRLTIAGEYEADEYSQVLMSVDGNLIGVGGNDYLFQLKGTEEITTLQDSGWRTATLQATLPRGVHTLAVGVWNNKKTGPIEVTCAYFDDVQIGIDAFQLTDASPDGEVKYRINAGGPMVTINGNVWEADRFYSGGQNSLVKDLAICGTSQDELYRSQRNGTQFSYRIPAEPGTYMLRLHLAEVSFASTGKRIFDVLVENGQRGISDLDIVSEAGTNMAVLKVLDNISVRDGFLDVAFKSLVDKAMVSAIEVVLVSIDT